MLRPGGVLVILGNYEDDDLAWCSAFERLVGIRSHERPTPSPLQGFRPAEVTRIRWSREQDVAALPDYALSLSPVAVLPDRQREETLAAVRRMAGEHPDLLGLDPVTVPMQVVRWIYHGHGHQGNDTTSSTSSCSGSSSR